MGENQRIVFVNNLRRYMERKGVDQSCIVAALGFSASTVSDWVTGKKYPRVDAMQKLADYFGVLLSDLTSEDNDTELRSLTPTEYELISIFRSLNDKGQDMIIHTARSFAINPDLKKDGVSNITTA